MMKQVHVVTCEKCHKQYPLSDGVVTPENGRPASIRGVVETGVQCPYPECGLWTHGHYHTPLIRQSVAKLRKKRDRLFRGTKPASPEAIAAYEKAQKQHEALFAREQVRIAGLLQGEAT